MENFHNYAVQSSSMSFVLVGEREPKLQNLDTIIIHKEDTKGLSRCSKKIFVSYGDII